MDKPFFVRKLVDIEAPEGVVMSKVAEAAEATAIAHQMTSEAREAQQLQVTAQLRESIGKEIKASIEHAFMVPDEPGKPRRFVDVTQITRLCDDIDAINKKLDKQVVDMAWIKWLGSGFVAAGGLLALKSLGL